MKIETKYDLGDRVKMLDPGIPGRIVEIKITPAPFYFIEYWWEGELKTVWLSEDEIAYDRRDT